MTMDRNPFEVLALSTCASAAEIERTAQRLLAELAMGVAGDTDAVREHEVRRALDELRDPRRRLEAEVLSRALIPDNVGPADFQEFTDALTKAARVERPDAVLIAEEMLWASIEFPPPFELPADHEETKRAAFVPLDDTPPPLLSFGEVDWREIVGIVDGRVF